MSIYYSFLQEHKIDFLVDPPEGKNSQTNGNGLIKAKCPIQLQKETPQGLVDTTCQLPVEEGHAGLCRSMQFTVNYT